MITQTECLVLDAADTLADRRSRFDLPPDTIYLDGNSLGAMPANVPGRIKQTLEQEWARGLIRSWNDANWYPAPQRTGNKIATLTGAEQGEIIVADSTSVNLFKVLVAAKRMRAGRRVILAEKTNFPTNVYIATSVAQLTNSELRCVDPDEVLATIDENTAVVSLTHVNYRTGKRYDMEAITRRAHEVGALIVWDLCHSVGAMPIHLNRSQVDFAVGCGYKYLNGGPGAPSFVFVARRHLDSVQQPLTGWHGHARPFDFTHEYVPHSGIERMLTGTAPQIGILTLEAALEVFDGIDLDVLRDKSVSLGNLFIELVDQELEGLGFSVISPRDAQERGSQVSLLHEQAHAITQALISRNVINGFRAPDVLRFGLAPLYVRHIDVWNTITALREITETRAWDSDAFKIRKAVS
ncbi:kynureninase [Paraburkholderia haematera]|jgi:kynureninase|uniref:Kynureninase n=1 Tax=Paraburkholderia haematera TaxID=2793077 RepID=A0ABM8SHE4_9BURK|nr:kynureninase [Paraburkholderia haematera]CAE6809064.1 Kynureninase [Paraburkholderia haematera]